MDGGKIICITAGETVSNKDIACEDVNKLRTAQEISSQGEKISYNNGIDKHWLGEGLANQQILDYSTSKGTEIHYLKTNFF